MWETIQAQLYNFSQLANNQVLQQLNQLSLVSIAVIFTADRKSVV